MPQKLASLVVLEVRKIHTVIMMMRTNNVSRGESTKMMRLPEKMSCLLQEVKIYLDTTILRVCTVPYNLMQDENAMMMNERVRPNNDVKREAREKSILSLRLLDVAWMMENSLPGGCSSDGIHFDRPKE